MNSSYICVSSVSEVVPEADFKLYLKHYLKIFHPERLNFLTFCKIVQRELWCVNYLVA